MKKTIGLLLAIILILNSVVCLAGEKNITDYMYSSDYIRGLYGRAYVYKDDSLTVSKKNYKYKYKVYYKARKSKQNIKTRLKVSLYKLNVSKFKMYSKDKWTTKHLLELKKKNIYKKINPKSLVKYKAYYVKYSTKTPISNGYHGLDKDYFSDNSFIKKISIKNNKFVFKYKNGKKKKYKYIYVVSDRTIEYKVPGKELWIDNIDFYFE